MAEKSGFQALLDAGLAGLLGGNQSSAQIPGPLSNESAQLLRQADPANLGTDPAVFDSAPAVNTPQRAPAPAPQPAAPEPLNRSLEFGFNTPLTSQLGLNTGGRPSQFQLDQQDRLKALVEKQGAGVSDFKDVDFGSLAALVDNATGSKLAPALRGNVNVARRDQEIAALRKSLSGGKAQNAQDRRDARFIKSQELRGNNIIRKDKNKMIDSLSKVKTSFSNLEDALDAGDFVRLQNALSNYARVISGEKGVLTDRDIVRVLPNNMKIQLAKAQAYFSETGSTKLPVELTTSLRAGIVDARNNLVRVSQEQLDNVLSDAEGVGASAQFANKLRRDSKRFVDAMKPKGKSKSKQKVDPSRSRLEELRAKKARR